jgi:chloride channel 3/4/5
VLSSDSLQHTVVACLCSNLLGCHHFDSFQAFISFSVCLSLYPVRPQVSDSHHPPRNMAQDEDTQPDGSLQSSQQSSSHPSLPPSPTHHRRRSMRSRRQSLSDQTPDERTSLLRPSRSRLRIQSPSGSVAPKSPRLSRHQSYGGGARGSRHHSRHGSWGQRLIQGLSDRQDSLTESKGSIFADERVWYDQFTSTDWVHDSIADSYRVKELRARKGFWARLVVLFDGAQGWILSAVVGFLVAVVAYCVDVAETTIFDYKDGYCAGAWYLREKVYSPFLSPTPTISGSCG